MSLRMCVCLSVHMCIRLYVCVCVRLYTQGEKSDLGGHVEQVLTERYAHSLSCESRGHSEAPGLVGHPMRPWYLSQLTGQLFTPPASCVFQGGVEAALPPSAHNWENKPASLPQTSLMHWPFFEAKQKRLAACFAQIGEFPPAPARAKIHHLRSHPPPLLYRCTCCCAAVAAVWAAEATPCMCWASATSSMFWFLVSHTCTGARGFGGGNMRTCIQHA